MLYQEVNTYAHQDSATSLDAHKDDSSINARSSFPNTISDVNSSTKDASCFMIDREENKERTCNFRAKIEMDRRKAGCISFLVV